MVTVTTTNSNAAKCYYFTDLTMAMSILPFLDMFNETNSGRNSTHPDVESKFSAALLSCPSLAHSVANRCNAFTSSNKKAWRTAHVRPCFCRGQSGEIRHPMICKTKRHTGCIFFNHLPKKSIKKTLPFKKPQHLHLPLKTWKPPTGIPTAGERSLPSTAAPIVRTSVHFSHQCCSWRRQLFLHG